MKLPEIGYKLCSTKLLVLLVFSLLILAMYHTVILMYTDKLSGNDIVRLYEITLNTLMHLFGIFVAGNIMSKPFKKRANDV